VAAALPGPHLQTELEDSDSNDMVGNNWGADSDSEGKDSEGEDLGYEAFEEIVKPKCVFHGRLN
jgi:hypothetical protein